MLKVLDLIAAVKHLHELSPQQLAKLMKDSGHNVVQYVAEDGSLIQVTEMTMVVNTILLFC